MKQSRIDTIRQKLSRASPESRVKIKQAALDMLTRIEQRQGVDLSKEKKLIDDA